MKKLKAIIISLVLVLTVCSLSACQIFFTEFPPEKTETPQGTINVSDVNINYSTITPDREKGDLVEAVAKVYDSVVCIENLTSTQIGEGCGVIVDVSVITEDNTEEENCFYVLTCFHVIEGADELKIKLADDNLNYSYVFSSKNFAVSLVGGDDKTDIAILKLDISNNTYGLTKNDITVAKLMDVRNTNLVLGEDVFAIGNPSGTLPGSVTKGIVSYINRDVEIEGNPMTLLQIDAALNQGNSGGGLFNLYGELVGMVNGGNVSYEGLNFAIPLEVGEIKEDETGIIKIMTDLIKTQTENSYGYVEGRWQLGVVVTEGSTYGPFGAQEKYVYVHTIVEGGAISKSTSSNGAKIKEGYIIDAVEIDGVKTAITDLASFETVYAKMQQNFKIGDTFKLHLRERYSSLSTTAFTVSIEQFIYNPNFN